MTAPALAFALAATLLQPLPAARTYTIRPDGTPLTTFWGVEDIFKTGRDAVIWATSASAMVTHTKRTCPRCGRTYNTATEWHDVTIKGQTLTATVCAGDAYDALIRILQERGLKVDVKEAKP